MRARLFILLQCHSLPVLNLSHRKMYQFLVLVAVTFQFVRPQILTSELTGAENEVAEEIANKTYAEEQSDLQRAIFKNYDRKIRPVRNQSTPVTVLLHAYLMHFSVDQLQQTVFMNGHIYLTWSDEMAVWDPASFNNIRSTMAKQWELWGPDLRIANSVSGVNQYFEISKRSHATLTSVTPNRTKVEIYPTFSMKIGCNFDYSEYPFDLQNCSARLYTTSVMSEVELSIYYQLDPSVMLGWGDQSGKRHVSEWELMGLNANLSFYKNRKYSAAKPLNSFEAQSTWSLILLTIELRRNAPLFWLSLALPSLCCVLVNVFTFLLPRPEHSIALLLVNFFLLGMFIRDTIRTLPPSVGATPRIVVFANLILPLSLVALLLHLCSRTIARWMDSQHSRHPLLKCLNPPETGGQDGKEQGGQTLAGKEDGTKVGLVGKEFRPLIRMGSLFLFRLCCFLLLLLLTIPLILILVLRT